MTSSEESARGEKKKKLWEKLSRYVPGMAKAAPTAGG